MIFCTWRGKRHSARVERFVPTIIGNGHRNVTNPTLVSRYGNGCSTFLAAWCLSIIRQTKKNITLAFCMHIWMRTTYIAFLNVSEMLNIMSIYFFFSISTILKSKRWLFSKSVWFYIFWPSSFTFHFKTWQSGSRVAFADEPKQHERTTVKRLFLKKA